jgi:hypothetical protein
MTAFWELVLAKEAFRPFVADCLASGERDDVAQLAFTIYLACTLTHKGQASQEYAIMGAFKGKLGRNHERELQETELFAEIMTALGVEQC